MNARYYDPATGRFLSQDTYSGNAYEPWTQHLYSYCGNNPVNMVDPTGHCSQVITDIWNNASADPTGLFVIVAVVATVFIGVCNLFTGSTWNTYSPSSHTQPLPANPPMVEYAPSDHVGPLPANPPMVEYAPSDHVAPLPVNPPMVEYAPSDHVGTLPANPPMVNYDDSKTVTKEDEEAEISKVETPKRNQEVFPANPYDFHPIGLIRKEYPGTNNGRFVMWFTLSDELIFEWDEDFRHGSHYHAFTPEMKGAHNGIHYYPGDLVPEPWNTLYF